MSLCWVKGTFKNQLLLCLGEGPNKATEGAGLFSPQTSRGDGFMSISFQNNMSEIPTPLKPYQDFMGPTSHLPLVPLRLEHFEKNCW